jgi:3-hydroxyisobutyryl-CoA hydrolase
MSKASPTSLRLTLLMLQKGSLKSFSECLRMEHRMVQAALLNSDFTEGVTALLVEKRAPVWASAPSVPELQKEYFDIRDGQQKLQFTETKPSTFWTYPHHTMSGLPTAADIKAVVDGVAQRGEKYRMETPEDVVEFVMNEWGAFDWDAIGTENGEVRELAIKGGIGKGKGII